MLLNKNYYICSIELLLMKFLKILECLLKRRTVIKTENASSVFNSCTEEKPVVESSVPTSCVIGNMILNKEYDNAILTGERILSECSDDYFAHCNLMVALYKVGDIEKCNKEAKLAIIKGHHTGFCENRLSINLYKQKKYHQVIQLSDVLENSRVELFFEDVHKRKLRALKHIKEALDTEHDILFTEKEIEELYENVEKLKKLRTWYLNTKKRLHEMCYNKENYKRLFDGDKETKKQMDKYQSLIAELDRKYGYLQ